MDTTTAWLKPHSEKGGLDHLAVQAPCISIYGRLLPGITNVTDRARYYSFYPWFFWAFDRRETRRDFEHYLRLFRRADCLFTLIAGRHELRTDWVYEDHRAALVGGNTLTPVLKKTPEDGSIELSRYATTEKGDERYFANRLGGFGQYYRGTLQDLGLVGEPKRGVWGYTTEEGQEVAKAMDAAVDGDLFFETLHEDQTSLSRLDELQSFCPCALTESKAEHSFLVDMIFDRKKHHDDAGERRRSSLGLILTLAGALEEIEGFDLDDQTFRSCVYSGFLPGGRRLELPKNLERARASWAIYQTNELLSIAAQGVFFTALDYLDRHGTDNSFSTTEEYAAWVLESDFAKEALGREAAKTIRTIVEARRSGLPSLDAWDNQRHELHLGAEVRRLSRENKDNPPHAEILRTSLETMMALAARGAMEQRPYRVFAFPDDYFVDYPINLRSFHRYTHDGWQDLSMRDLLRFMLTEWGLDTHFRVALRKLRHESRDTFRVRPTERGFEFVDAPVPVFTTPRFRTTRQVLRDLGVIEYRSDDGGFGLTPLGHQLSEEIRAS